MECRPSQYPIQIVSLTRVIECSKTPGFSPRGLVLLLDDPSLSRSHDPHVHEHCASSTSSTHRNSLNMKLIRGSSSGRLSPFTYNAETQHFKTSSMVYSDLCLALLTPLLPHLKFTLMIDILLLQRHMAHFFPFKMILIHLFMVKQ